MWQQIETTETDFCAKKLREKWLTEIKVFSINNLICFQIFNKTFSKIYFINVVPGRKIEK